LTVSLDGFVAGPDQSRENPIGIEDPGLVPVEVAHSPRATHIGYRVGGDRVTPTPAGPPRAAR